MYANFNFKRSASRRGYASRPFYIRRNDANRRGCMLVNAPGINMEEGASIRNTRVNANTKILI